MSAPRLFTTRWRYCFEISPTQPSYGYRPQCLSKSPPTRCMHHRTFTTTTSSHHKQRHKEIKEKGNGELSSEQIDRSYAIVKSTLLVVRSSNSPPPSSKNTKRNLRRKALLGILLFTLGSVGVYIDPSSRRGKKKGIFDTPRFTPFTIASREMVSPTSIILTVRPQQEVLGEERDLYKKEWEEGTWSVEVKQPQLQIARSYTPLPPADLDRPGDIRFIIRREKGGEVSGYLHNLKEGETIWLRGPKVEYKLPENITDIAFLAGGTGIAPALQVTHTLLERRHNKMRPRISILWANRTRSECNPGNQMVEIIETLQKKHPDAFTIQYLVDEEKSYITQRLISSTLNENTGVKTQPIITSIDEKIVFISGPEGFVNWLAGPKVWEGGKEGQGVLGGVLGRMGRRDWKVWKL